MGYVTGAGAPQQGRPGKVETVQRAHPNPPAQAFLGQKREEVTHSSASQAHKVASRLINTEFIISFSFLTVVA